MYFYDDTDDWPEYKVIKDEIHRLEMEHLEVSKELQEVQSAFMSNPANEDAKAKIDGLKQKLKEIEKKLNESPSMYR
jgi:lipid II:glycine glycyltransferase (peptidoglycan interpeptide bridge formation enzyme)